GPELSPLLIEQVRRAGAPVALRTRYRGEELRGELRPLKDGFQMIAIPGPGFLERLLASTQLLAAAAGLYLLGGLVVLGRHVVRRRRLRDLFPRAAQSFRGRLVALFVLTVMIPLTAVTFFLRS